MENSAITFKCPNCGGELLWNAEKQIFVCKWCSSDFAEEEINDNEPSAEEAQKKKELDDRFIDDTDVYVCSSCGAEIFCDHNTAASFCYYCHNPVALRGRLTGKCRPDMIIPFCFNRLQAEAAFKANCMKRWFLPSDFTSSASLEKITGLYVPFWLADCEVDYFAVGEGSQTIKRTYSNQVESQVTDFRLERGIKFSYMGIPADGSFKLEDSLMDAIEPYDYKMIRPFDMTYLAGFFCDKYDVEKAAVVPRVKERISEGVDEVMRREMNGYDNLKIMKKNVRLTNINWHYVMLPVWLMTYKHNGKMYGFAMNGQTGKFAGKYPVSNLKAALAGIVVGIISAIIILTIGGMTGTVKLAAAVTGIIAALITFMLVCQGYEYHEKPAINNYLDLRKINVYHKENTAIRVHSTQVTDRENMFR